MQVNLTQAQLKRILELLEKAKENRSDTYLYEIAKIMLHINQELLLKKNRSCREC
jgi:predicted Zn-ribbon and HTH transcriptional regulator